MVNAGTANEELLQIILNLSSGNAACGSAVIAGEKVLLVAHDRPAFLPPHPQCCNIILVQPYCEVVKASSVSVSSLYSDCHTPGRKRSSQDLNITGSPLRAHFAVSVSDSPFTVSVPAPRDRGTSGPPLTIIRSGVFPAHVALNIWSALRQCVRLNTSEDLPLPLFIAVDGQDCKGTIFHGMTPGGGPRFHVWGTGPRLLHKLPSLDTLKATCTGPAPTKVEMSAEATYELFASGVLEITEENVGGDTPQQQRNTDTASMCVVSLVCRWLRPLKLLARPAPDATTELTIRVPTGQQRGLVTNEVRVLMAGVAGVINKQLVWPTDIGAPSGSNTEQRIQELLEQHKPGHIAERQRVPRVGLDLDSVLSGKQCHQHNTQHFLPALWAILVECGSLSSVRSVLRTVLRAIATNVIRPQIHARDTTKVGTIALGLMRGKCSEPALDGLQPLHMMIELGLYKVTKDITSILLAGNLTTEEQLAPFIAPPAATDDAVQLYSEQLLRVQQLQVVLHVITCLRVHLSLPHATLATYTVQLLEAVQNSDAVDGPHVFHFPLQTSAVTNILDGQDVVTWRVNISSEDSDNGTYRCDLLATVTRAPIVRILDPTNEFAGLSLEVDAARSDETRRHYYCNYVTAVTDSIM